MRRLSATILATTIVSLAALQPAAAASPKAAVDDNCAIAKGDGGVSIKARLGVGGASFGEMVPVYRVDRIHLRPRPDVALHRHGRPQPGATIPSIESTEALAAKAKTPLGYSENAKDQLAGRTRLPGGFEGSVAPVVTSPLLTAHA